jgi:hypothetical protein
MAKSSVQGASPNGGKTEGELFDERGRAAGIEDSPIRDKLPRYRALAFSGGGIRSATFALGLGVLEAIAKDRLPVIAVGMPVTGHPPAQIRTCPIRAYGSYLGCLTANVPYTVQPL